MKILFINPVDCMKSCNTLLVGVFENSELFGRVEILDQQSSGFLSKSMRSTGFNGKFQSVLQIVTADLISDYENIQRIVLVGLGEQSKFDLVRSEKTGGTVSNLLHDLKIKDASAIFEGVQEEELIRIAFGVDVKSYRFTKYKTQDEEAAENFEPGSLTFGLENEKHVQERYLGFHKPVVNSMHLARDLITEPANVLNPEEYTERIKDLTKSCPGLKVEILDEKAMQKLGMNALLAVGKASSFSSRLAVIKWEGAESKDEPYSVFVGKGVTFDTGGISLKPSKSMWEMIYDMAGSAAVVGAMHSLASQKVKANVVGIVAIVENAISGNAQRPGDIVKSASGKTIEVLNTDAEGRLILADALWYAQEHFKVKHIIDVATLTGAIVVALGNNHGGLFTNNDQFAQRLIKIGKVIDEPVWRMPLSDYYDKLIDSDVADMKNISTKGYGADSITAAQFLQRFIEDGVCWAHLDIAGIASDRVNYDISPKGPSAFGVRILTELIVDYYGDK